MENYNKCTIGGFAVFIDSEEECYDLVDTKSMIEEEAQLGSLYRKETLQYIWDNLVIDYHTFLNHYTESTNN